MKFNTLEILETVNVSALVLYNEVHYFWAGNGEYTSNIHDAKKYPNKKEAERVANVMSKRGFKVGNAIHFYRVSARNTSYGVWVHKDNLTEFRLCELKPGTEVTAEMIRDFAKYAPESYFRNGIGMESITNETEIKPGHVDFMMQYENCFCIYITHECKPACQYVIKLPGNPWQKTKNN